MKEIYNGAELANKAKCHNEWGGNSQHKPGGRLVTANEIPATPSVNKLPCTLSYLHNLSLQDG